MENLGKNKLQVQASPTDYKRWKKIIGVEDMIEEIDKLVKENIQSKTSKRLNDKTSRKFGTL